MQFKKIFVLPPLKPTFLITNNHTHKKWLSKSRYSFWLQEKKTDFLNKVGLGTGGKIDFLKLVDFVPPYLLKNRLNTKSRFWLQEGL